MYPGIAPVDLGLGCGPGITTFKNSITGGSETTVGESDLRDGKEVQFGAAWRQVDTFRLSFRIGGLLPDTVTESSVLGVTRMHLVQRITQALWKCFSKLESPSAFSEKWMYKYPIYQQVYLGLKKLVWKLFFFEKAKI